MSSMTSLSLACPAKINLALSVAKPRPDGMHCIASWMTTLNFADRLQVQRLNSGASRFTLQFDANAPVPGTIDWPLEKDLVYRAHTLMQQHAGHDLPVSVALSKLIPTGAGLGGGSSNAASMLVALNRLFELQIPHPTLIELSRKLGSDVAFFIGAADNVHAALVTGLGEKIEPLPLRELLHIVLIFPLFGCPTGPVYKAFDELIANAGGHDEPDVQRVRELATKVPLPQDAPFNDLAEPACRVRPELHRLRDELATKLDLPVHITGSGSTMFVISPSAITAKATARKVTAVSGLPAMATRTM